LEEQEAYIFRNPGFKPSNSTQWKEHGIDYLRGPGKNRLSSKLIIKGNLILSALGGWVFYETPKALACTSESMYFKNAVMYFSKGEINKAECQLFGSGNSLGSNCFVQELADKVDPKIAILFEVAYFEKLKEINTRCNSDLMRYTK
jgi:hypothetical protein